MKDPTQFHLAVHIYKWQALSALILSLLVFLANHARGMSFFYGVCVILLGNAFLTWRVYQKHKTLKPLPMLRGFFGGEFGKYCILIIFTIFLAHYATMNWLFYVLGLALPQLLGVMVFAIVSRK